MGVVYGYCYFKLGMKIKTTVEFIMLITQLFIASVFLAIILTYRSEINRLKILTKTPIQYEKIHEPLYRIKE